MRGLVFSKSKKTVTLWLRWLTCWNRSLETCLMKLMNQRFYNDRMAAYNCQGW